MWNTRKFVFRAALLVLLVLFPRTAGPRARAAAFDPFVAGPPGEAAGGEGPAIPEMAFSNEDIATAFQIISDATGWSIVPTTDVSKAKISVWAKGMSARQLLDTVVTMAGFTYRQQGKVITVMTYDEYAQFHGLNKEVVFLKHASVDTVALLLKPFLSKIGICGVHLPTNALVVLDSEANLKTVLGIIEKLDSAESAQVTIEVLDLKYMDAVELADTLQKVFAEPPTAHTQSQRPASDQPAPGAGARTSPPPGAAPAPPVAATDLGVVGPRFQVAVYALERTNQLILRAFQGDMDKIKALIEKLDAYIEPSTKTYRFTYVDASEIFTGLEQTLNLPTRSGTGTFNRSSSRGGGGDRTSSAPGGMTLVAKNNSILLTAPPSLHRIMASIVESVDVAATYETGLIRIYKIENADVEEVAQAIKELLQSRNDQQERRGESQFREPGVKGTPSGTQPSPAPPAPTGPDAMELSASEQYIPRVEARIAVSKATNSVIVQATARQHRELERLVEQLDKRRQQVLIESRIVEVTRARDSALGAELSYLGNKGYGFTSFGLSAEANPATEGRDVLVSSGGTAVVQPGELQILLRALQADHNARVTSAPRLLVNDNASGTINSVAEEPYTRINQGQNTDTVSFGGFVEAGTQFLITPHISTSGYLRIEYEITLNSFTAKRSDPTVPPARSTSSIKSEATVPSGHTIVVGGLQTSNEKTTVEKVPLLGDIPLLGLLFRSSSVGRTRTTTYLFITPRILDQQDFRDLKEISDQTLQEMENNDPTRTPDRAKHGGFELPPD